MNPIVHPTQKSAVQASPKLNRGRGRRRLDLNTIFNALSDYATDETVSLSTISEKYSVSASQLSNIIRKRLYASELVDLFGDSYVTVYNQALEKSRTTRLKVLANTRTLSTGSRILTPSEVEEIGIVSKTWSSTQKDLARHFRISTRTLKKVLDGDYFASSFRLRRSRDLSARLAFIHNLLTEYVTSDITSAELMRKYNLRSCNDFTPVIDRKILYKRGLRVYSDWETLIESARKKSRGHVSLRAFSAIESFVTSETKSLNQAGKEVHIPLNQLSRYVHSGTRATYLRSVYGAHYDTVIASAKKKLERTRS